VSGASYRRGDPVAGPGWTAWTHGSVGCSAKVGGLRADIAPEINPATKLQEWHVTAWHYSDRAALVHEAWGMRAFEVGQDALAIMAELAR